MLKTKEKVMWGYSIKSKIFRILTVFVMDYSNTVLDGHWLPIVDIQVCFVTVAHCIGSPSVWFYMVRIYYYWPISSPYRPQQERSIHCHFVPVYLWLGVESKVEWLGVNIHCCCLGLWKLCIRCRICRCCMLLCSSLVRKVSATWAQHVL